MNVVVKRPGYSPERATVPDDPQARYRAMHNIVGGYLEAARPWEVKDLILWCNEDGKLDGLAPNIRVPSGDVVVGPVLVTGIDGPDEVGLTDEQANLALLLLTGNAL